MRCVQVLGLPQDNNSSFMQGPALAPAKIREAFHSSSANLSSELGIDFGDESLWRDGGDVPLDGLEGQAAFDAIKTAVTKIVSADAHAVCLGGDHSVSFPAISAHLERYDALNILHIDAHPDLYDDMQNNPFSHASPFARLMETGQIARLVQVGIRTINPHQREQAERFGVEVHEMRHWNGPPELVFDGPVYLSLDIDALDPAFAPGVSHYEPGGLSTREVLHLVQGFTGNLIGADIVELNPSRDPAGITAMVAAKLCKDVMARILNDGEQGEHT